MAPSISLVVDNYNCKPKYISVPAETITGEFPGPSSVQSQCVSVNVRSHQAQAPSGTYSYQPETESTGHPEGAASGLGYHSITPTEQSLPTPPPQLSDLILSRLKSPSEILRPYLPLLNRFYDWSKVTEKYYIYVKTIKPGCKCEPGKYWGYDSHVQPILNRFSYERRFVKIWRMNEIFRYEEELGTKDYTLITLTRGSAPASWKEFMEHLCRARKLLLDLLKKYCPGIRHTWVVEPHTEDGSRPGWPHIHLMVAQRIDNNVKDSQGRGMEDKLRDLYSRKWKVGSHTYGLDFEFMDTPGKALNYMLKYIGKSFVDSQGWSDAVLIFNAHIFECFHELENGVKKKFRSVGYCKEYSDLFAKDKKEPTITLDARLIPMNEEDELPEKEICKRPQLIPDWLGDVHLIKSILKGAPDYTARFEYDSKGKALPRPSRHWGRPCEWLL